MMTNLPYQTTVDQHTLYFLKLAYFKDLSDSLKSASRLAYLDFNRTLNLKEVPNEVRLQLRREVLGIFREELPQLTPSIISHQDQYDCWHYRICCRIKQLYASFNIRFTFGQAQKWVNMTLKYLYMLEPEILEDIFPLLHVPIDNYILKLADDYLQISLPTDLAWSKWDDYNELYLPYQNAIRKKVGDLPPLRWEFEYWSKAIEQARTANNNRTI
ncbi:hypothetical protein ACERC5_01715 [Streptococcus sp. E24BD]